MKSARLLAAAFFAALLCACGGEAPQEGEVTGEVLEGTISDEMLELEQVRSRAPLADPSPAADGQAPAADGEDTATEEPEPDAEEAPADEAAAADEATE